MTRSNLQILSTLCVLLVCTSSLLEAQDASVTRLGETGNWNGLYIKAKLSDKLGYYGEHHYRRRNSVDNLHDFVGRMRQVYNRAGINFFFSPYFEGVIGPTLVFNYSPDPENAAFERTTLEPRIWHQWLLMMPAMGRTRIYHQFRFEHRWKRDNLRGEKHDYTNRYRYKIFAFVPLNSRTIETKTFFFSPSAEIFLHSGKSVVAHPFEDFRTYNGFGYVYSSNVTFFAGHMWTLGQKPSGFEYQTTHIIRLNVMVGLDLRKVEMKLPPINIGY